MTDTRREEEGRQLVPVRRNHLSYVPEVKKSKEQSSLNILEVVYTKIQQKEVHFGVICGVGEATHDLK